MTTGRRQKGVSAILVCQSDGQWTGQPPVCEHQSCDTVCLNGGSCTTSSTNRKCSCPPGYSGDRCQHGMNHLFNSNKSKFFIYLVWWCSVCVCDFGTLECHEIDFYPFLAHCILPCLHGGTCVAPYRCACRPGRTGERCQTRTCSWVVSLAFSWIIMIP